MHGVTTGAMSAAVIAPTPTPPYVAVIFTSLRTEGDRGYEAMAEQMAVLGSSYPGFLGLESARTPGGLGITVSYWRDMASVRAWREDPRHLQAQAAGRSDWYEAYRVRIANVESDYAHSRDS